MTYLRPNVLRGWDAREEKKRITKAQRRTETGKLSAVRVRTRQRSFINKKKTLKKGQHARECKGGSEAGPFQKNVGNGAEHTLPLQKG